MWQKILKNLHFSSSKRYILVFILISSVVFFGKDMHTLTPEQQELNNQAYAQQKNATGIYDISVDQSEHKTRGNLLIKKGQCGRIFFDLKNLPFEDDSDKLIYKNVKIKISLSNDFGEAQALGSKELKDDGFSQSEEIDFCANADYQNLVLQTLEYYQGGIFEISNLSFLPLSIKKTDLNNLVTPIIGTTDFSRVVYQSGVPVRSANKAVKFTRNNQEIGQIFVADSETVSGVDLKLKFIGNGGMGNYILELKEVVGEKNKHVAVSSDKIASYYFNQDSAEKSNISDYGSYHFPLAAHLEKGKSYFVGISNEEVEFNIINTLKVYAQDIKNEEKIVSMVSKKASIDTGALYLRVYGADFIKSNDEKILTGAQILDNGDGFGSYSYRQKNNFSDYLDLDQLISPQNGNIYFDPLHQSLSAIASGDNAFTYSINMVKPFLRLKIEAHQPGIGFVDSRIYYSFDQNNWHEIKSDRAKLSRGDENRFQELISGDGKMKTIFLKVTYDNDDIKRRMYNIFGLKNLTIHSELDFR